MDLLCCRLVYIQAWGYNVRTIYELRPHWLIRSMDYLYRIKTEPDCQVCERHLTSAAWFLLDHWDSGTIKEIGGHVVFQGEQHDQHFLRFGSYVRSIVFTVSLHGKYSFYFYNIVGSGPILLLRHDAVARILANGSENGVWSVITLSKLLIAKENFEIIICVTITVPADGPVPSVARASVGTVLTKLGSLYMEPTLEEKQLEYPIPHTIASNGIIHNIIFRNWNVKSLWF